jgi:hypothetical protein
LASEGQTEGFPKGLPTIGSVLGLQRTLAAALGDIRRIADGMLVLPELARILTGIEDRVTSMDSEVREMRGAVEKLNAQVDGLRESLDEMAEPLGEIGLTLHPLRRSANRIGRIGRRGAEAPAEPAPDES